LEKALLLPLDEFESTYGFRKPGVEDPLVFYCRSGKRSGLAASIAEKLGYKEIYDYSGSWIDWNQ
jgi:rhodanese-related sulfurtransferase